MLRVLRNIQSPLYIWFRTRETVRDTNELRRIARLVRPTHDRTGGMDDFFPTTSRRFFFCIIMNSNISKGGNRVTNSIQDTFTCLLSTGTEYLRVV